MVKRVLPWVGHVAGPQDKKLNLLNFSLQLPCVLKYEVLY